MITKGADGWYFIPGPTFDAVSGPQKWNTFGPYANREAAENCRTNYEAYVENAPVCHH